MTATLLISTMIFLVIFLFSSVSPDELVYKQWGRPFIAFSSVIMFLVCLTVLMSDTVNTSTSSEDGKSCIEYGYNLGVIEYLNKTIPICGRMEYIELDTLKKEHNLEK